MEYKDIIITCPNCGQEYLPAEIYYPNCFFGKPNDISRDKNGKITFFTGKSIDSIETFKCLNCGCYFKVEANINFSTTILSLNDSDEISYKIK